MLNKEFSFPEPWHLGLRYGSRRALVYTMLRDATLQGKDVTIKEIVEAGGIPTDPKCYKSTYMNSLCGIFRDRFSRSGAPIDIARGERKGSYKLVVKEH